MFLTARLYSLSGWKSDQLAFRESHSIFFKIYLDVTFDSESNEPSPSSVRPILSEIWPILLPIQSRVYVSNRAFIFTVWLEK